MISKFEDLSNLEINRYSNLWTQFKYSKIYEYLNKYLYIINKFIRYVFKWFKNIHTINIQMIPKVFIR